MQPLEAFCEAREPDPIIASMLVIKAFTGDVEDPTLSPCLESGKAGTQTLSRRVP